MKFEHLGVKVTVDKRGYFCAKVEEAEVSEATLDGCYRAIEELIRASPKERVNLPVCAVLAPVYRGGNPVYKLVENAILTGIHRNTRALEIAGGPELKANKGRRGRAEELSAEFVLPDTAENRELLRGLIDYRQKLERLQAMIERRKLEVEGYGRLGVSAYKVMLRKLEEDYEKSLRLGRSGQPKAQPEAAKRKAARAKRSA